MGYMLNTNHGKLECDQKIVYVDVLLGMPKIRNPN